MRHISESIIGRKGSHSSLPTIRQWDIVRTRDGNFRMCIVDEDLIRMIPRYGDYGDTGLLVNYYDKKDSSSSIIDISKYNNRLEYTKKYLLSNERNNNWDIMELYRPDPDVIEVPKFKHELINLTLNISLSRIAKNSKLIFKR